MTIHHPYREASVPWLRGNLHAHTTMSDGDRTPQDLIDQYAARGYDFLAISDHDMITDATAYNARGMTLIPANEVTINGPHTVHIGATIVVSPDPNRQAVLDGVANDAGFAFMAHPSWERHFNHCPQESLESLRGYTGIEIVNGITRWHPGSNVATDRWDRVLSQGRRVWGFANDDAHHPGDEGVAWNMVQSGSRDATAIVQALRAGSFYASTGVCIESIRVAGNTIAISTRNAQRIVASIDYARRIAQVDAAEMVYTVPSGLELSYVRFECFGAGEAMAWTQPFFVSK
ncbi:MAG: CehA/McbA family metallohydrolase [Candidatus Hydrogenedentes bacterium]|nr:CehA/McbA family metallohydrolase [Candidatus Hydrogenedentota bacterium]